MAVRVESSSPIISHRSGDIRRFSCNMLGRAPGPLNDLPTHTKQVAGRGNRNRGWKLTGRGRLGEVFPPGEAAG